MTTGDQDPNAFGQPVLELGADYQSRTNGGDGWLRLLEIDTRAGEVRVQTYSPTLNQYERDADSEFIFTLASGLNDAPVGSSQNVTLRQAVSTTMLGDVYSYVDTNLTLVGAGRASFLK